MTPTPTTCETLPLRRADFTTLTAALDYAAKGSAGFNFFSARGELTAVLPYRELRERAIGLAQGLIRDGMPRGARLVLLGDTDPEIVTAFLACQYAGLIPVLVPIPASLGGREAYVDSLKRLLKSSGAIAAIAPDDYWSFLEQAAAGMPEAPKIGRPADFMALPGEGAALRPFGPDESCYYQYSSGSTRWPLGVDIPQHCLMANGHGMAVHGLGVRPGDRGVSWLPLYHDMGLVGFMLTPLLCQVSVDFLATRDFARRSLTWLTLITDHGSSLSYSPTFGYDLCCRRAENSTTRFDLRTWRAAGIGGDMIQPHVLERFAETFGPHGFRRDAFVPSYGMAEATLAVSVAPLERGVEVDHIDRDRLAAEQRAVPVAEGETTRGFALCGSALPGHEIEIRSETGETLAERQVGRVFVRGPSIAPCYVGEPEASAAVFVDGWLDTGDLGYLIDGAVVITGRSKDLILINGRNVWPQDIEWAIETLPGLRRGDVAAFAVEEALAPPRVVVLIQCRRTDPEEREALVRDARAMASTAASVEAEIVLVRPHGLPVTSSGKLSRARARKDYLAGAFTDPTDEAGPSKAAAVGA